MLFFPTLIKSILDFNSDFSVWGMTKEIYEERLRNHMNVWGMIQMERYNNWLDMMIHLQETNFDKEFEIEMHFELKWILTTLQKNCISVKLMKLWKDFQILWWWYTFSNIKPRYLVFELLKYIDVQI